MARPDIEPESATRFYDRPVFYDWLHDGETAWEMGFVTRVVNRILDRSQRNTQSLKSAARTPLNWLEPACGTGRFLRFLARCGAQITGYDLNDRSLSYAKRTFARQGLEGEFVRSDMAEFVRPGAFDAAFNLINSFRHILDEREAAAHLRRTAESLKPGGIYLLGIDLFDYDVPEPMECRWNARRRGREIRHLMITDPPSREDRLERIINHFVVQRNDGRELYYESTYDLRAYDLDEWMALVEQSPFEIVATYTFAHEKTKLNKQSRDVNLVLRVDD